MRAFFSDFVRLPLPAGHRFPIDKYRRLRERVTPEASQQDIRLCEAPAATSAEVSTVHTLQYLRKLRQGELTHVEQRRIGFPWSPQLVTRSLHSAGGTVAAARAAMTDGVAVHLAGGTHHAFADSGQGFCVLNDVAIAVRALMAERRIERALVIDCDVHQGNGTADIFGRDPRVFTFSMHGDRNFPFRKRTGDLDVSLPDGADDDDYLRLVYDALEHRLPLQHADVVFYLAGADPYVHDRLGRLNLTKRGLAERDRAVLHACRARSIPTVVVMAGGYARQIDDIVEIHANTVRIASHASRQA